MTTAAADAAELVVFPVGHYTGAFHPSVDAPARYHSLRIGRLGITLDPERGLPVWAAAHRPLDDVPGELWTRARVADLARDQFGVTEPESVMAEFFETGVLVEVALGAADAVGFAQYHRVAPLMFGMGNSLESPLTCGFGLPGLPPVVEVPSIVSDVLQWGSVGRSLWDVCRAIAASAAESGSTDPRECDPTAVLDTFLRSLPALLAPNAAYIDEARQPSEPAGSNGYSTP